MKVLKLLKQNIEILLVVGVVVAQAWIWISQLAIQYFSPPLEWPFYAAALTCIVMGISLPASILYEQRIKKQKQGD